VHIRLHRGVAARVDDLAAHDLGDGSGSQLQQLSSLD
jgi:hypothetical protein